MTRQEQKHEEAKLLVKHVFHNDLSAFKSDYEKIQKRRIVDEVRKFKTEFVNSIVEKTNTETN